MLEGLRGYVQLASGLSEATAAKAREVAQALVAQGGVSGIPSNASTMAVQIAGLAEDLIETARSNRGVLVDIVRTEVERGVAAVGVVTAPELEVLRRRLADIEAALADPAASHTASAPSAAPTVRPTTPQKPAAKKASGKTASATGATAENTSAKTATAKKTPAKRTTAKRTTAKRTTAKRTTAKKTTGE